MPDSDASLGDIQVGDSHTAVVGGLQVRRALPRVGRRTVGAWCFVDHMGPAAIAADAAFDVAPHPHIGLQTVTWLLSGEAMHRDSLGTEQLIRPGQLNLMTAGHGIVHSEEHLTSSTGTVHGVQLWVALPDSTRHGAPAFEHHAALPQVELPRATATVLIGQLDGQASPARRDTDHVGIDLIVRGGTVVVPLTNAFEHAVVVTEGRVQLGGADGPIVTPGHLAYLDIGREELRVQSDGPSRLMLIGGTPFPEKVSMFWNFVARTHDEMDQAVDQWNGADERFGPVHSQLARIPSPTPPWRRPT